MSTTTSRTTKATALTQVQALIAGTQKHFPTGSFTVGSTAYTAASMTQILQGLVNALTALNAAHVQLKAAGLTFTEIDSQVAPLIRDYKRFVLGMFGTAPATLADFGVQPPKAHAPLTSEQRAAATAKMRATRAARGTTSKKQKLTVKGDVKSVIITPVTSSTAPAPTAPPAVPAPTAPASSSGPAK